MPWLFTYGSLMNPRQFNKIAGKWKYAKKAKLYGYQLVFTGKGSADIVPAEQKNCVYGVAYEISEHQLVKLDRYEGVPSGFYYRKTVHVEFPSRTRLAFAYMKTQKTALRHPPSRYCKQLISGLRYHGYGEAIIREMQKQF